MTTSRLVKHALLQKKLRGERTGTIPWGYEVIPGSNILRENAVEQAIIRMVASLRESGLSLRKIVQDLAERGAISRVGKPFGKTQIVDILKSIRRPV